MARSSSGIREIAVVAMVALLAASAPGCRSLSHLESDLCGNGVVEPGEDCEIADSLDGTCGETGAAACHFICDASLPAACPSGWSCGADGICRQGDGAFAVFAELGLTDDRVHVADFNGDGYSDIAASSPDILRFRLGPFVETEYGEQVEATRAVATADVNGDGSSDGFIASEEFWSILLGSPELRIDSSFHPSASLGQGRHIAGVAPLVDRLFTGLFVPFGISQGDVCQGGEGACVTLFASNQIAPIGFSFDDFAGPAVAGSLGNRDELRRDVRVAAAAVDASEFQLFPLDCSGGCGAESLVIDSPAAVSLLDGSPSDGEPLSFLSPRVAPGGVHFGDGDGDGDEDVLIWAHDGNGAPGLGVLYNQAQEGEAYTRRLVGTCATATCPTSGPDQCADDMAVRRYADRFTSFGGAGPGRLLAVGQIDGAGFIDLVTSTGIFLANGSGQTCGFDEDFGFVSFGWVPRSAPWSQAVVGDLNGDGIDDVAAISPGSAQIEIYRGEATGALTRLVLDTKKPPRALAVGDLDADGADDLIYARGDAGASANDIVVSWGNKSGGVSTGEVLGQSFPVHPGGLAMGPSLSSLADFDADSELFITTNSAPEVGKSGSTTLTVVRGSANRAIASPIINRVSTLETAYDLQGDTPVPGELDEGDFEGRAWCVGTVAAGRFFSTDGSLDLVTIGDLVAVPDRSAGGPTGRQVCEDSAGLRFPILEARRGAGNGNVDASAPWCEPIDEPMPTMCARSTLMSGIELDGDGLEELVIVAPLRDDESGASCALGDVRERNAVLLGDSGNALVPASGSCVGSFAPQVVAEVDGVLRKIERRDFDGNDAEDLLVTTSAGCSLFLGRNAELGAPRRLTSLPADGCEIAGTASLSSGCGDNLELAVLQLCEGEVKLSIWAVEWFAEGLSATERLSLEPSTPWAYDGRAQLEVADITGDGLDDILARVGDRVTVFSAIQAPAVGSSDVCLRRE